jgi:prophage antirepressor-like protein
LDTLGGMQDMAAINESGLFSLIFSSRNPEAKQFKRKVLPSDKPLAIKIYKCCYKYLKKAEVAFIKNDIGKADRWITEYQRFKQDLDRLIEKKQIHEKRKNLLKKLLNEGHNVEMITWKERKEFENK